MLHPFLNPNESSFPSLLVYKSPKTGGAGSRSRAVESMRSLPAKGTPEEMRLRLSALEGQVNKEEARRQLEGLKSGMELQEQAQQQEAKEVDNVMSKLGSHLESAPERNALMANIQNHMTLQLAILAEDGEISESQLAPNALESTLQSLLQNKGSIKVKTAHGERNLYTHEQSILGIPGLLKNHSNEEVKKAWEEMSQAMQQNVRLMRASSKLVAGKKPEQSMTGKVSDAVKNAWEGVVDKWDRVPQKWKTIATVAAAAGLGIYLLNKIFKSDSRGNESSGGSIMRLLGVGALIAGGVYLYGRMMKVDEAWNKLKGGFKGLTQEKFTEGLAHFKAGRLNEARVVWGEHASGLIKQLSGRSGDQNEASQERNETDEHGVEYAPVGTALGKYKRDLEVEMLPLTAFIENYKEVLFVGATALGLVSVKSMLGGLKMTAGSLLGFAKFLSSKARHHPLITTMLIVSFAMNANRMIPKDGANLKKYINSRRQEFSKYLRDQGVETQIREEEIDLAADVVSGDKTFAEAFKEPAEKLMRSGVAALSETLRISKLEKIKKENGIGLVNFANDVKAKMDIEGRNIRPLIDAIKALRTKVSRTGVISSDDLAELQNTASNYNVKIQAKNGYLWWGETNDSGQYLDEGNLRAIGMDSSSSVDEQYERASRFEYNPEFSVGMILRASTKNFLEEIRGGVSGTIEHILKGDYHLIIADGVQYSLVDGIGSKYIDLPVEFGKQLLNALPFSGNEFSSKELIYTYAEGIVPVTMLGIGSSLIRARSPFSGAGKWKLLSETLTYPVRGVKDLHQKAWKPYSAAVRASSGASFSARRWDGLKGIAEFNGQRIGEFFGDLAAWPKYKYASLFNKEAASSLYKARELRSALQELKAAESALGDGGKIAHVKDAIRILNEATLFDEAKMLDHLKLDRSMDALRAAISTQEGIAKGILTQSRALLNSTLTSIKNGSEVIGPQIDHLREMAKSADMADEFSDALKAVGVADDQIDVVKNALKGEENLVALAETFRRTGLIDEAVDGLKIAEKGVEKVSKSRRLLDLSLDVLKKGGELSKDGAIAIWNALRGERASALYQKAWKGLSALPGASAEKISQFADACKLSERWGQLKGAVSNLNLFRLNTAAEAVDTGADLARAAVTLNTATDAVRGVDVVLEGAETVARTIRNLDTALDAIKDGQKVGYMQLRALQQGAQGSGFKQMLRNAGVAADQIDAVADLLKNQKELGALSDGLEASGALRLGKGVKGMLTLARIGGPALAIGGLAAGGMEAWQANTMANLFQENEELRNIYENKRDVNIAAALACFTIDIAAGASYYYGAAAMGTTALGRGAAYVGGVAALPLTVIFENIRYVYSAASDASQEIARTDEDWFKDAWQKGFEASEIDAKEWARLTKEGVRLDADQMARLAVLSQQLNGSQKQYLLHSLVNTTHDTGAGEAYSAIFTSNTMDDFRGGRQETMSKLLSAIIKIDTGGKSVEYNQYRMKFINAKLSSFDNIEKARKAVDASVMFADIMQNRDQTLSYSYEDGAGTRVINLRDQKFDADKIQVMDIYSVMASAQQINENGFKQEIGEKLYERIEGLDKNYLNYAVNVMMLYIIDTVDKNPRAELNEEDKKIQRTAEMLRRFLLLSGYQFTRMPSLTNAEAHMEDLNKVIFDESTSDESVKDAMVGYVPRSKGAAAIYVYALASGYKGTANIGDLEKYFIEEKKDWLGIYYNKDEDLPGGGEWVVNEEGMESDNESGSNPDLAALKMIQYIKEDPGNILTSRFDYITDLNDREDESRREKWMLELARRMERAYNQSSAPSNEKEWESASTVDQFLTWDTWKEGWSDVGDSVSDNISSANDSIVENLDSVTKGGYSNTVNAVRNVAGSVLSLSPGGKAIISLGNTISGWFSSDEDED